MRKVVFVTFEVVGGGMAPPIPPSVCADAELPAPTPSHIVWEKGRRKQVAQHRQWGGGAFLTHLQIVADIINTTFLLLVFQTSVCYATMPCGQQLCIFTDITPLQVQLIQA